MQLNLPSTKMLEALQLNLIFPQGMAAKRHVETSSMPQLIAMQLATGVNGDR